MDCVPASPGPYQRPLPAREAGIPPARVPGLAAGLPTLLPVQHEKQPGVQSSARVTLTLTVHAVAHTGK